MGLIVDWALKFAKGRNSNNFHLVVTKKMCYNYVCIWHRKFAIMQHTWKNLLFFRNYCNYQTEHAVDMIFTNVYLLRSLILRNLLTCLWILSLWLPESKKGYSCRGWGAQHLALLTTCSAHPSRGAARHLGIALQIRGPRFSLAKTDNLITTPLLFVSAALTNTAPSVYKALPISMAHIPVCMHNLNLIITSFT